MENETLNKIASAQEVILKLIERDYQMDIPLNRHQSFVYLGISGWAFDKLVVSGDLQMTSRHGINGYLIEDLNRIKDKLTALKKA